MNRHLTSWKSTTDPSAGDYSFKLDYRGFPEIFLESRQQVTYRSGPWNGIRFSGVPEMESTPDMDFTFEFDQDKVYYSYHISNPSLISRLTVNSTGSLQRMTWVEDRQTWSLFWYLGSFHLNCVSAFILSGNLVIRSDSPVSPEQVRSQGSVR